MADQTTHLDLIQQSSASKEVISNALDDAASPSMLYGRRGSTTSALTWGYYGGVIKIPGSPGGLTKVANSTIALTASVTNYIEQNPTTGVVSRNSTAFTVGRCPLYKVTTNTTSVTNYEDWRFFALGTA